MSMTMKIYKKTSQRFTLLLLMIIYLAAQFTSIISCQASEPSPQLHKISFLSSKSDLISPPGVNQNLLLSSISNTQNFFLRFFLTSYGHDAGVSWCIVYVFCHSISVFKDTATRVWINAKWQHSPKLELKLKLECILSEIWIRRIFCSLFFELKLA